MKLKRVLTEDDAVSPVIGVILMVAITVVMAAITGAFVLSLQNDVSVTPTTSWDTSAEDTTGTGHIDSVRFLHRAGDSLDAGQLKVRVSGQQADVNTSASDGRIRVGDEIDVRFDDSGGNTNQAGDELLLVWTPSDSDDSVILTSHRFLTDYGATLDSAEAN